MTQAEFAALLEVNESSIRNYETDRNRPHRSTLKKILDLAPEQERNRLQAAADPGQPKVAGKMQEGIEGFLPAGIGGAIRGLARAEKKSVAQYYAELVTLGLQQRLEELRTSTSSRTQASSRSPREAEEIIKRQSEIARGVYARHQPEKPESLSRKGPKTKTA